ncbi:MAG: peptidase T [Bacillota bacterium]|jgi:tripeptide aminopeptidase
MMNREQLLNEGILAKFLRYVQIDSPAEEGTGQTPSTPEQLAMARVLCDELLALGLSDAKVDQHGFVTATLPGNKQDCPVVGFLAHMDTVPGVPNRGVRPLVHENYQGGVIQLPSGAVLNPEEFPTLKKVVGHTLVTSDGNTLLGADDKAGIAAIMEAVCFLLKNPQLQRGTIKVAFTPDEEIGTGIGKFDVKAFGADLAYTLDGGAYGEMQDETFNAANYRLQITGKSSHTGTARDAMINAIHLASHLASSIPAHMRPETTDGYRGFIHPNTITGTFERVNMQVFVRDFTEQGLQHKEEILQRLCQEICHRYPGAAIDLEKTGGYRNMKGILKDNPLIVQLAQEAIRMTGTEPVMRQVRGGTDGSQLTYMGLPTPNLFDGGSNAHSRLEWASVQWMQKAVEVVLNLCQLWSSQPRNS